MRNAICFALLLLSLLAVVPASANPTGAPLLTFPVAPCRVFDTRVALGPIPANTTYDIFVRGSALPANYGARKADCGVPPAAEAVLLNVVAINPTAAGVLVVDGTGYLYVSTHSTLNFSPGITVANEVTVSLCNAASFPSPQVPCVWDGQGRYMDAQVYNGSSGATHVLADVVGYLARQ